MNNLIIVESPTKAKTLSKFLGKDYAVEATIGHIKDLPKSKLGVDVEHNFKPDYIEVPKQAATIKHLKAAAKKAKQIYIATDPDREGEAIAAHVEEIVKNGKAPERITFHEITQEAVEEAIAHPQKVNKNLVEAQIARRVLDRLVGYKLSPLLWKKVRIGLSAGRVQTVAVRLIVEKEREIKKFKPVEYWEISSDLKTKNNKNLNAALLKVGGKKAEVGDKKTADKIVADLKKAKYQITDLAKKEFHQRPYAPFTTSTLTQAGANLFGWSSKKTMAVAQKLYENGHITYHRTDSLNIAKSAQEKALAHIKKEFGDKYLPLKPRFYKTSSKSAQEAHEAIRPTKVGMTNDQLSMTNTDNGKLYSLINKRFLASQMADAVFDRTAIDITATNHQSPNTSHYLLRANGQTIKFDGWKKVYGKLADEVILPEVAVGDALDLVKVNAEQKFTQPPARFNEASLIKTLEKLGIGRPSTYAPTISTIQVRKYVEKQDGKFFPTTVGVAVNDFLLKNFDDVFDYQFTAEMEDDLDKVAEGKLEWEKRMKTFYTPLAKKLKDVEKNADRVKIEVEKLGKKCPECGKEHGGELVIRMGRFGKFISCSRFPDCKHTEKFMNKINMKCPECGEKHGGEVIIKRTGKGRSFYGCSRYPDCKFASWKDPSKEGKEDKKTKKKTG